MPERVRKEFIQKRVIGLSKLEKYMNQHLSNPHTSEARNYIHQRLKNFASAANSSGRCSGLAQFIGCISDPEVIKKIPISKIVLETDSPYLPPTPFRGKRNEPSYLIHIAEKLAGIFEVGLDEIAKKTSENALNLFKLKA